GSVYPKKTHWTAEITPNLHGTEVVVAGWVASLGDYGRVKIVKVSDREGGAAVPVYLEAGKTPDHLFKVFAELSREDVVVIKGIVEASKGVGRGVEIFPSEIWILNKAKA
uniref:OBody NL8 n=1 Tax=Pyrobaculum aerophilum TaxID=13773 RepID=UPI000387ACF1|nr:Chain C, OBody NL8 [Pyrobaculum aerophilum]4GLA_D Chain D, OBody NL8 [Pyrobaculum aerophilum]